MRFKLGFLFFIVVVAAVPSFAQTSLKVRMGYPIVIKGPLSGEGDSPYTEVALTMGKVRSFGSHGTTWWSDGWGPLYIDGPRNATTGSEVAGSAGACGNWIQDVEWVGSVLVGVVHNETACRYDLNQTHKSVSIAMSQDVGKTWTNLGTIISGSDAPTPGALTGEGDCTLVERDGYVYAYCLRQRDWRITVARASATSSLAPGEWWKWTGSDWSAPALGGDGAIVRSDTLSLIGSSVALWRGSVLAVTPDWGWAGGGIKLSYAADGLNFITHSAPLTPDGAGTAGSPSFLYLSMLNRSNGSDTLGDSFLLSAVYMPTGDWANDRYLIMYGVTLYEGDALTPDVLLPLTRWWSSVNREFWTTTGPTLGVGNHASYGGPEILGYLLSEPDGKPVVQIDECVSFWPGHPDHLITNEATCRNNAAFTQRRPVGWAYTTQQEGTVPFYRCFSTTRNSHFASLRADCEGLGVMEWRLGFLYSGDGAAAPWY